MNPSLSFLVSSFFISGVILALVIIILKGIFSLPPK